MSNFASTIDKEQLQSLETAVFPGKIVLLDAEEITPELEEIFRAETLWGFDTESKPVFKKGAKNRIALIQMATKDTCYLVRLSKKFPPVLTEIFNNPEYWRVFYVQNIHTNWDMEVKFVPYKVPYVSGYRTVKEFIEGPKPRYLL